MGIDITPFLEPRIAPRAVFDQLATRHDRVRFYVPDVDGADGWRGITWGTFADDIRRSALFLAGDLSSGDRAAIFAPNRVEWITAALAIQAAGGTMVPIYPASTSEQAGYVLEHSDAKVVLVDTPALLGRLFQCWTACARVRRIVLLDNTIDPLAVLAKLRAGGGIEDLPSDEEVQRRIICWTRTLAIGSARDAEDPSAFTRRMDAVSLDQPGLMLYTSGTSGNPKGVPLTHRMVAINGGDWLRSNAPLLDEGDVDLLWLPMSHIFGLGEACLGNTLGWTTYLTDPTQVMTKLPELRPTVFMSVPSLWEKLAIAAQGEPSAPQDAAAIKRRLDTATGGRLRFCLSGGAGLKREVKDLFFTCGILIIEGYGLTECSPTLTLNTPGAFRFDSVGKPLPSVELKLAEDGEILARGPSVFSGYHKDPVATREAFTPDGWFQTGDVGRFTDDGFLQIVDRKKDILVTAGGKNVPPANIELRFYDDPCFAHVVVYGDGKRFLVAGVWLNEPVVEARLAAAGQPVSATTVQALVQSRIEGINAKLASYETIKKFHVMGRPLTVQDGLLTATLKVRRKKVYEAFRGEFEGLYEAAGSRA